jgi:hypothetical protein
VDIAKDGKAEFVFADNTLIVEANNPDNTGTLKNMKTTVLFFDDAEGELQGYAERRSSAYYAGIGDLPAYSAPSDASAFHYYPPYAGKSIALGGAVDARLSLSLNLDRKAKLSFWYANKDQGTNGGAVLIDGTQKAAWQGDYNWAYREYPLEAGIREIVWTKDGTASSRYSYLSLDNILVIYTE